MNSSEVRVTVYNILSMLHRYSKILFIAVCLILVVGAFALGSDNKNANVNASTYNEKYYKCINIYEDDTLWSIAEANISEEYDSIEEYIAEVKYINNLTSDKIYCGATLVIPYYAPPM